MGCTGNRFQDWGRCGLEKTKSMDGRTTRAGNMAGSYRTLRITQHPVVHRTLQWYITTFKCLNFVDLQLYPYLIPNRVENIL